MQRKFLVHVLARFALAVAATMHCCILLLQKQYRKNKDVFNLVGPNLLLEDRGYRAGRGDTLLALVKFPPGLIEGRDKACGKAPFSFSLIFPSQPPAPPTGAEAQPWDIWCVADPARICFYSNDLEGKKIWPWVCSLSGRRQRYELPIQERSCVAHGSVFGGGK